MKYDPDTIQSFLLGLLERLSRIESLPSGKVDDLDGTALNVDFSPSVAPPSREQSDNPMEFLRNEASSTFISDTSTEMPPFSELGELPAVQDHFQTVLKRRLQVKISENPPLFPWESSLAEYPVELSTEAQLPWMLQLRALSLPTVLPENVLMSLLERCQGLLAESMQPGAKLVKAVEDLFPEQPQAMNQIAGLVLANATMRGMAAASDVDALRVAFPDGYEGANPQQQVTLTMLAANCILDTLTLSLSPHKSVATREWDTTEGQVSLRAEYQSGTSRQITVAVDVPHASQLSLPTLGQTVTQRSPGTLTLTLPEPVANLVYPLELFFSGIDALPLTFAISWSAE